MTGKLRIRATSLSLILIVALGLRLGYAWEYQRTHSKQALSVIPFLFESGNIAYSLYVGNGFGSPFRVNTGPTAWVTPVYPPRIAGVFRLFGAYTFRSFLAAILLNILFAAFACVPIFFASKRIGASGLAARAAWLWAVFPNAILIPIESIWGASLAALLVATILWATLASAESRRLVHWCGYGLLWGFALMTNAALGRLCFRTLDNSNRAQERVVAAYHGFVHCSGLLKLWERDFFSSAAIRSYDFD